MEQKTLCVTGHRPSKLWGYNLNTWKYKELNGKMRQFILDNEYTHFISGMALGIDTLFALTVLKLKRDYPERGYTLECAIPCQNHSAKWFHSSQVQWQQIVDQADKVTMVTDSPYTPSCMQKRNEYMVDQSDAILAYWDGTSGGTANCVRYAEQQNKPVFNLKSK